MLRRLAIALVLLLSAGSAYGQMTCTSSQACLAFVAPTKFTDGTVIPTDKVIAYKVYRAPKGSTAFTAVTTTNGLAIKLVGEPVGEQCYAITAIVDNAESVLSNTVCKIIRFPGPTDGALEAPSNGSIENP